MGPHKEAVMAKHGGLAWRVALAILLGASVLLSAPALGARVDAADANPVAGLTDAKVAFDITAGDAGRVLNILNTIDETREAFIKRRPSRRRWRAITTSASVAASRNSALRRMAFSKRDNVGCEPRPAPLSGSRPSRSLWIGSWTSRAASLQSA